MTAPTAHADAFNAPSSGSCSPVTAAAVAQTGREAKKKKRPHMKTTIFEVRGVGLSWELGHSQPLCSPLLMQYDAQTTVCT